MAEQSWDTYLKFVDSTAERFRRRATRSHYTYNAERVLIIILSLSVPLVSTAGIELFPALTVPLITTLIAILAALDGLFKPGEIWHHYRSYEQGLLRLKRLYVAKRDAPDALPDTAEKAKQLANLYSQFVADTEGLLQEESKSFWPQRIQALEKAQTDKPA